MDSPKQSTVEIRQDHGFNSSVVAGISNALGSQFTINQVSEIFKEPILKLNSTRLFPYLEEYYFHLGKAKGLYSRSVYSRRE